MSSQAEQDACDAHKALVHALDEAARVATIAGVEFSYAALVELQDGTTGVVAHMGPNTSALARKSPDMYEGAIAFLFQVPAAEHVDRHTQVRSQDGVLMSNEQSALAEANDGMGRKQ